MSRESDRIKAPIGCLDTDRLPATLISTVGAHCDVWKSRGYPSRSGKQLPATWEMVIKCPKVETQERELPFAYRDYVRLRDSLMDIIPEALFLWTRVDGVANVVVLAEGCTPWFNLANPSFEEEAIPLLEKLPKARRQLNRFIRAARRWRDEEDRVIDLYGIDNLVLDINREVRYLDSFEVFFFEDMLHLVDDPDDTLREKIKISLKRLDYLEYLLRQSGGRG